MNCLHLKQSKFKIALSKERTILTVKSIKILLYVCTLRLYLTLPNTNWIQDENTEKPSHFQSDIENVKRHL